jgi:hypothetical protein
VSRIIEIYNYRDLLEINSIVFTNRAKDFIFKIMNDIDLKDINWLPIGFKKNGPEISREYFCGEIDGQNHIIKNMCISMSEDMVGFVGSSKGIIKNLYFDNTCYIDAITMLGTVCAYNQGQIFNCKSSANLEGKKFIGGICGRNTEKGVIQDCSFFGKVKGIEKIEGISGSSGGVIENSTCRGVIEITKKMDI